jgi:TolB protein
MIRPVNIRRSIIILLFLLSTLYSVAQKNWRITYVHWKDTVSAESWINTMNKHGGDIKTIIDYPGSNWMPMAMGKKIWFQIDKDTTGKKKGLYVYNSKTGKEKFLFEATGLYQDIDYNKKAKLYIGCFSHKPDGSPKNQYDIFLFNEDGTYKKAVTIDTAIDLEPVFSPDGKQIIFRSNRDRNPKSWAEFELYSINKDGTNLKRLTYNPDTTKNVLRTSNPCFTPDGRIAFTGYWDGTYRIMVLDSDRAKPKPLLKMDEMEQTGFCFSNDGKMVVFTGKKKGARNADIYIVNTDGTNLRQLTNDWKRKVQPFFLK